MDATVVTVLLSCLQVGAAFYTVRAGWKMTPVPAIGSW